MIVFRIFFINVFLAYHVCVSFYLFQRLFKSSKMCKTNPCELHNFKKEKRFLDSAKTTVLAIFLKKFKNATKFNLKKKTCQEDKAILVRELEVETKTKILHFVVDFKEAVVVEALLLVVVEKEVPMTTTTTAINNHNNLNILPLLLLFFNIIINIRPFFNILLREQLQ